MKKLFRWAILVSAVIPLIYGDNLLYPYLAPKTLLLRALGIISVALFAYLAFSGEAFYWQRIKGWMTWIPGALLAVAYASSALGIDFYTSFWSSFERGDGLLTLTVIATFFYLILLSADKAFVANVYKVVAWVGSLVAVHALLQWLEALGGFSIPFISQTAGRLGGTLGNAAFLASYLGLSLIATLFAAQLSSKRSRTVLYIGAALQLLIIILTATRGSILALGLVSVAALIYIGVKGSIQNKKYARGGLVAIVIVAALFFAFRSQLSKSSITPIARVASISLSDSTVSSRLFLWKNLTKEALPYALTGVGAEHITVLFDKVYDPGQIDEQWFDRSHNAFLDYFIQFGIFGFLLYLILVLSSAYTGWKLFAKGGKDSVQGLALLTFTGVYAVQNFFVFDTAVTLWLFVALFASALITESNAAPSVLVKIPKGEWAGAVVGILILLLVIPVSIQPLRANILLADAYTYHVENVTRSVDSMQKGLALGTYANIEYGYEAYQMFTGEQLTQLTGADLEAAYKNAEMILEQNFNRYPYDARTATYLAHVLDSAPASLAPAANDKLPDVLAKAIELSPKRSQPWYLKANIYIQQGDNAKVASAKTKAYNQAIDVLKEYVAQEPTLAEPRYVIATLYLTMGDKTSAKQWADEGLALYTPNGDEAGRAVKYYIAVEDWAHAEQFLQDIVNEYPTDYDSWYDLAKASYLAGDVAKAKAIVAQLQKAKPGFVESDPAFLQAVSQ